MTGHEPFVSVVTPFHNTDAYLEECIQSVLAQEYRNFEYILVDNQSTDRSGEIAEKYARLDPRVRVVRTEQLINQVPNYNFALEQISRDAAYCKMCQADDWLFPRCLTEMVARGEAYPSAAIISSYYLRETDVYCTGISPHRVFMSGADACRLHLLGETFLFGTPTTVLYRGSLVREKRTFYEEGRLHEDTELCFEVLDKHDFAFVHQVLSFTRVQEESITGGNRDLLPEALDRVIVVKRWGERYLSSFEYQEAMKRALDQYYRSLAWRSLRQLVRKPREDFWEYQRKGLATVGEKIEPARLARHVAAVVAESVLSPLEVARKTGRALQ